jgi:hypothetical protein
MPGLHGYPRAAPRRRHGRRLPDRVPKAPADSCGLGTCLRRGGVLACIDLGGLADYTEAHRATTLQAETAALDKEVALVESCGEASPALFRVGDDFVILTGSDGNDEFWNSTGRDSSDDKRPKKSRVLVRCQLQT